MTAGLGNVREPSSNPHTELRDGSHDRMMEPVEALQRSGQPEALKQNGPMVVQLVTFTTRLHEKDVLRRIEERGPEYRAVPGLVQKLYIRDPASGEYGGIYVWEDAAALAAFQDSELARTIPSAYRVNGRPRIQSFEIVSIL
jgi:heme-degrading monooxygenase HmoA